MKRISITLFGALLLLIACNKQDAKSPENETVSIETGEMQRQCAAEDVLAQQIALDPQRERNLINLEIFTQQYKRRADKGVMRAAGKLYVPVVVHIVSTNPAQVTDAQITSQIDVLNKDFSKTNSELANQSVYLAGYSYNDVPNCEIEFYVAQTIRKTTTVSSFGSNDAVKKTSSGGSDPVNATTMLNLWVCDLSSGLLGYAQFPGGNAATDGVVIDYQAFGTFASYPMYTAFNKGRTATHEVGHWFNLRHIWGDRRCGDDFVGDTPMHDASNSGCPANNLKSACQGKPLEQWMNYMDYTNDACMYMFSAGQKIRMDAAIDGSRAPYVRLNKL